MISFEELLKEARAGKRKKKARKKKAKKKTPSQAAGRTSPKLWDEEMLVLVAKEITCTNCGNSTLSWNRDLYIQRKTLRVRNPITKLERLGNSMYDAAYGNLPKRVEVLSETSPTCPLCFGIGDWQGNTLTGKMAPVQLAINFKKEKSDET